MNDMSKESGVHSDAYESQSPNSEHNSDYDLEGRDVFGNEANHGIKYKTLSWQIVSVLMIAEIVSNGMLSLPSSLATVGMVPGLILIIFLGIFATYTSTLLVDFKLRHPEVHNMGDAGYVLFGWVGREIFSFGTFSFAILLAGGQMLSGQIALSYLSNNGLCALQFAAIFCVVTFLCSLPRTFDNLGWLSVVSVICIIVAGLVGMIGARLNPVPGREVVAAQSSDFDTAFFSITNPVFAYCGHFMFFALMSEMKRPKDAIKAAYTLQGFATSYYAIFAAVTYGFIGSKVASPSFSSIIDPNWAKAAYGIALPNLLLAGSLYSHTASKVAFLRIFRGSRHLHEHTWLGWTVWVGLVAFMNIAAFLLAVGVPVFNYLIGIAASLFAAWFTYGISGMFWFHDNVRHSAAGTKSQNHWLHFALSILTMIGGAFICVAGFYTTVKAIILAYANGTITAPFTC